MIASDFVRRGCEPILKKERWRNQRDQFLVFLFNAFKNSHWSIFQ